MTPINPTTQFQYLENGMIPTTPGRPARWGHEASPFGGPFSQSWEASEGEVRVPRMEMGRWEGQWHVEVPASGSSYVGAPWEPDLPGSAETLCSEPGCGALCQDSYENICFPLKEIYQESR